MNCVYKQCPTALYSADQSRCSILSHDTLHHCLSCNKSLENGDRELGHLLCYCSSCCKNTFLTILFGECAHSTIGNLRVHYLKSDYVIELIAFWWDTTCIHSSPDPSLFQEVGLTPETILNTGTGQCLNTIIIDFLRVECHQEHTMISFLLWRDKSDIIMRS